MFNGLAKIFLVAVFMVAISACTGDKCKNVGCPAGESCHNGVCYCPDGYEGSDCATLAAQKFVSPHYFTGSATCDAVPPFGVSNNQVTMIGDIDPKILHISNMLGGVCSDVIGIIRTDPSNNGNIIEISSSSSCGATSVSGQGTWNPTNNQLVFNLEIQYNGAIYDCQYIFYRY